MRPDSVTVSGSTSPSRSASSTYMVSPSGEVIAPYPMRTQRGLLRQERGTLMVTTLAA